jgi:hippurate hydrolase
LGFDNSRIAFFVEDELRDWIIETRRHIHQYPELSSQEFKTAEYIQEQLAVHGIISSGGICGNAVIAELGEDDPDSSCVALRADMDALPVPEETGLPFASKHPGIMHACGHDGHVAMLMGAAVLLNRAGQLPGRIKLIFQPSEEHGNGASMLVKAGVVDGVDAIFSGHIDIHFRTGEITVNQGLICAYSDPFTISIRGRGGHAARPHEATDAIVAASSLVTIIQTLVSREVDPNRAEVITIGSFHAGTLHNVIASEATLQGTVRSTDEITRLRTIDGLKRIVQSIETMYDVYADLDFEEGLPAVINSKRGAEIAEIAAKDVVPAAKVISQGFPSLGGEDFSFYLQRIEGCMVRFGAALPTEKSPAHSSGFDFDENCLEIGSRWLAAVALRWLKQGKT